MGQQQTCCLVMHPLFWLILCGVSSGVLWLLLLCEIAARDCAKRGQCMCDGQLASLLVVTVAHVTRATLGWHELPMLRLLLGVLQAGHKYGEMLASSRTCLVHVANHLTQKGAPVS
jgi:hypothetical protein